MNANKLKGRIVEMGLSIDKVASGIGINPATMYRKLNGESEFTRDEILALAQVLNLTDGDIISIFFTAKSA